MLGQFLLIGQQVRLVGAVLVGRGAARAGAGDGADGHLALADADQDLGGCAHDLKAAHVEEEHEGRRVRAPQAAIQREGRQREVDGPALRGHHLEDVARADVVLGPFHSRDIALPGEV